MQQDKDTQSPFDSASFWAFSPHSADRFVTVCSPLLLLSPSLLVSTERHFVTILFVRVLINSLLNQFARDLIPLPIDPVMAAHDGCLDRDMSQWRQTFVCQVVCALLNHRLSYWIKMSSWFSSKAPLLLLIMKSSLHPGLIIDFNRIFSLAYWSQHVAQV